MGVLTNLDHTWHIHIRLLLHTHFSALKQHLTDHSTILHSHHIRYHWKPWKHIETPWKTDVKTHPFVAQLACCPPMLMVTFPPCPWCWSSLDSAWSHLQNNSEAGRIQWWYCWWIRNPAINSWYGRFPIVYKALYIPGGAGFLPSTVMMQIVG